MRLLEQKLGDQAPTQYDFQYTRKLYYHQGKQRFPMIRLCFNNEDDMRRCANLLRYPLKTDDWGYLQCRVWETEISTVRKLLTAQNLRYSQWFSVQGFPVEPEMRISTLEREYIVEWLTLRAIPPEICADWSTSPGILSVDIECYSNNHRAMPDKYNARHAAYMISAIYQRYKDPSTRRRYGIVIGDCGHIPPERLEGCEVIRVKDEIEMMEVLGTIVKREDPEVITGYNILGFDIPYLDHRIKRRLRDWPKMGRIIGEVPHVVTKTWKSGAYGHQSNHILTMEGRICIDLLPLVRRDFALDKYDLDFVCRRFLGKGKHDVKPRRMFEIYEEVQQAREAVEARPDDPEALAALETAKVHMAEVMEYCIQDSELVIDLFENINGWVGLVELSSIVGTTIVEVFTRGQQIRCLSQLYDLAARSGVVLNTRDVPGFRFEGGLVYEPVPGLYPNTICLDFSSLYPSIMMAFNLCYTTLVPPELEDVIPDEDCHIIEFDQEEGVEEDDEEDDVLTETKKSKKEKPPPVIKHYRFKWYKKEEGLLPRLVRQLVAERKAVRARLGQIEREAKALERLADVVDSYSNGTPLPVKKDDGTLSPQMKEVVQQEVALAAGTLNWESLMAEQPARRTKIASLKLMAVVLDKRQLAIKVSANSFFGFLGVHNGGKRPLIEGAMCITAMGRILITAVRDYIRDRYGGEQVAGDTDSVMMDLHISDPKQCHYWGVRLAEEITGIAPGGKDVDGVVHPTGRPGLFPSPLGMEFEKAGDILCFKKKRYVYSVTAKDGQPKRNPEGKRVLLIKGICLARRDFPKFLNEVFTEILTVVLEREGLQQGLEILVRAVEELLAGQVNPKKLAIIKGLGANYKSENYFMNRFGRNLRAAGKFVNPGDRLEFLVVQNPESTLLGDRMKLLEQYYEAEEEGAPIAIDYKYYLTNILMNQLNQLVAVGFKDEIATLGHITYRPTNRHKPVGLDRPVKILEHLVNHGHPPSMLLDLLRLGRAGLPLPGPPPPSRKVTSSVRGLVPPPLQLQVMPDEEEVEGTVMLDIVAPIRSIPITSPMPPSIRGSGSYPVASPQPPSIRGSGSYPHNSHRQGTPSPLPSPTTLVMPRIGGSRTTPPPPMLSPPPPTLVVYQSSLTLHIIRD
jgi:DNA polymerase elongation subunit (family B)